MSLKYILLIPALLSFQPLARAEGGGRMPAVLTMEQPPENPTAALKQKANEVIGGTPLNDRLTQRSGDDPAVARGRISPKREPAIASTTQPAGGAPSMEVR
ncbi:MAG: hypothetical protein EOP11_17460 [Proteobacteria bacterium]|nr:MAG: hypothetical protein EOP11_17460 [Pseudomonadota bacterium]